MEFAMAGRDRPTRDAASSCVRLYRVMSSCRPSASSMGVQVFTLQVFDERDLHRLLVGHFPDDDGDGGESDHAGCAPAPFTGNQLIGAIVHGPDQHGLKDAVGFDGLCQLL